MVEKPKNAKKPVKRGKGFYAALYGGIGGLLVLAVAIGYFSLFSPNDDGVFDQGEATLPVGGTMDRPVANIPQPPQTPPATPPLREQEAPEVHRPPEPTPQQTTPPQEPEPEAYEPYDLYAQETQDFDVHEVLGPSFVEFTENDDMHWPVLGEIFMDFSMDAHIFDITLDQWRVNDSISIRANRGEAVRAAAAGVVNSVENTPQCGTVVVIDHGKGWNTTYRQLDPQGTVAVGDVVSRGQIIGNVGTPSIFAGELGYHIGFNVQNHGNAINPHMILSTQP
jgi:murein DD-endopeptidase MepM/ murein hydrolase activator NlpD